MADKTTIQWIDSIVDLGSLVMGDTASFGFRFRNKGPNALVMVQAESSCSCTRTYPFTKTLKQGDSGRIKLVLDTRKTITGFSRKIILVTSNTMPAQKKLVYTAEITGHKTIPARIPVPGDIVRKW